MAAAGLVEQERLGRVIISRADFDTLEELAGFILGECCADVAPRVANDG
jgi:ArsR family transcriptional regulator